MVNQQKSFIATNRLHCVRKIGLVVAFGQNTQLIVQAVNDNAQRSYTEGFNRTHHGFLNKKKSSKSQQKVNKKSSKSLKALFGSARKKERTNITFYYV